MNPPPLNGLIIIRNLSSGIGYNYIMRVSIEITPRHIFIKEGKIMVSLMRAFSRNLPLFAVKGSFIAFIIFTFSFFFLVNAQSEDASGSSASSEDASGSSASSEDASGSSAPSEDALTPSDVSSKDSLNPLVEPPPEYDYTNYAQKGSYENENWFSEVPQWHYYDMFGNKITDGFYLYGLSSNRNNLGSGTNNIALHPFLRMWFSGLVQVSDLHENGGIMAMIGDRVKSEFTPFTLKQTLFAGARFDVFYKQQSLTFLTNRISNTGTFGMLINESTKMLTGDWITGAHAKRKFGEIANIGGTYVNLHHEESKNYSNPFSGVDMDTSTKKTPTGLSLLGLDFNLKGNKYQAYCEYVSSQEFLDGDFKPKSGMIATVNGHYDIFDKWRCGGEFYSIGFRYQTNWTCPAHPYGDAWDNGDGTFTPEVGKYQYSLVEDNDDKDEFPENGRSKYLYYTQQTLQGDPDGVIPAAYDKDKNGLWDYDEDFLNYDADPIESKILFDRNNNGTPDELEDDAYPDYPYVPSYYLPGERYYRYDDIDDKWENKTADSLTHKGLVGYHLYTRYEILKNLELTVGGIFDRTQEKTFQPTYENGAKVGEVYDYENASDIYLLAHYKKGLAIDKSITIENFFRMVKDNIPNHTLGFLIDHNYETVSYYTIVDVLDYRDMFADALRAEFNLFKNRGFNFTSAGKYEFQKHAPHPEFNYADVTISSLTLVNKCHYIFLLPFFKDLFLIPKYKNVFETSNYSPRVDSLPDASLDALHRRSAMINTASLVCEWKMTEKTSLTTGVQIKRFDDLLDIQENYWEPCFRIQLMIKDRYSGLNLILTTGFSRWAYLYNVKDKVHNPLNNPHRAVNNIDAHEIFIKVHAGF